MGGQLAQWAGAMSDLDFLEQQSKNPPVHKLLTGGVEAEAIEIFAARKKAQAMRKELRLLIEYTYGHGTWNELLAIEAEIRKQRKAAVYARQQARDKAIEITVFTCLLLGGIMSLLVIAYAVTR